MGFTQVSERMIQHHLVPFCCLSLKAREVVNDQFCVKSFFFGQEGNKNSSFFYVQCVVQFAYVRNKVK